MKAVRGEQAARLRCYTWAALSSIRVCSGLGINTIKACTRAALGSKAPDADCCHAFLTLMYLPTSSPHTTAHSSFFSSVFFSPRVCDDHVMCESLKSSLGDLPHRKNTAVQYFSLCLFGFSVHVRHVFSQSKTSRKCPNVRVLWATAGLCSYLGTWLTFIVVFLRVGSSVSLYSCGAHTSQAYRLC